MPETVKFNVSEIEKPKTTHTPAHKAAQKPISFHLSEIEPLVAAPQAAAEPPKPEVPPEPVHEPHWWQGFADSLHAIVPGWGEVWHDTPRSAAGGIGFRGFAVPSTAKQPPTPPPSPSQPKASPMDKVAGAMPGMRDPWEVAGPPLMNVKPLPGGIDAVLGGENAEPGSQMSNLVRRAYDSPLSWEQMDAEGKAQRQHDTAERELAWNRIMPDIIKNSTETQ